MADASKRAVVAVFDTVEAARAAEASLLAAGLPQSRVHVTANLAADGIAAEAPGQSYENQPGQSAADSAESRYGESVRLGTCVLTADADSAHAAQALERSLAGHGARKVLVRDA